MFTDISNMHLRLIFQKKLRLRSANPCLSGLTQRVLIYQNGVNLGCFRFQNFDQWGNMVLKIETIDPGLPVLLKFYGKLGDFMTKEIADVTCPESYQFGDGTQFKVTYANEFSYKKAVKEAKQLKLKDGLKLVFVNLFYCFGNGEKVRNRL